MAKGCNVSLKLDTDIARIIEKLNVSKEEMRKTSIELVEESSNILIDRMKQNYYSVARPYSKGITRDAIKAYKPLRTQGYVSNIVGVDLTANREERLHAVFIEYGSPTTDKHPFIRKSFSQEKGRIKELQLSRLRKLVK